MDSQDSIYLDNNATTRPCASAAEAVASALTTLWYNPSSIHRPGQAARHALELARKDIATLLACKPRELTFTSGGTESIDLAIRGVLGTLSAAAPRRAFVTARTEHAAVRDLAESLEQSGHPVHWVPVPRSGIIDPSDLAPLLHDAALVSIQWANNETGAIQSIEAISSLCRNAGALLHCDAVQWAGKEPITPELGACADLLSCSAHKFHGPKGVGVLRVRTGVRLSPRLLGTQELGRRGGTENVPGILGAAAAARAATDWLANPAERTRLASLRDRFEAAVIRGVPDAHVNSPAQRLWNTTNIGFPRLEAEALLLLLSEQGVAASAGAACSSGSLDPSPVLLAMNIPREIAHGSLRFSLSRNTTQEELDRAAAIIARCVEKLRASASTPGMLPT